MTDYTLAVGTYDPHRFQAPTEAAAIQTAASYIKAVHADDVRQNAQEAVTLMGPSGLITRPSERIDEFVNRIAGNNPGADSTVIQPCDMNTPDCNSD